MKDLKQSVKECYDEAHTRNADAADKMYDALVSIRSELDGTYPSIQYIRAVVARAIPK